MFKKIPNMMKSKILYSLPPSPPRKKVYSEVSNLLKFAEGCDNSGDHSSESSALDAIIEKLIDYKNK